MNTFLLLTLVPVAVPLLGALGYAAVGWGPVTAWLSALCAGLALAAATTLAATARGAYTALGGLIRVDALSEYLLIVIGAVGLLATAATPAWLRGEIEARRASSRAAARHSVLVQLFLAAMAAAVLASSLGVVWVAVEGTTIVTAFLVGQRKTRSAVEAAWKYVVICSAGIALALLGLLLLNEAAAPAHAATSLDWASLVRAAPRLDPAVTRIAVALLIVGFGTKAGLAPLHAWLPDAHGQAPAPVSALMSGVLLSVAFYAVLRVKAVSDLALGVSFARILLAVLAAASLLLAASLLIRQRDAKRMLAYSSIEHMGVIAFGAAAGGPLAIAAVLLHMLGHGLAKGSLFVSAGRILQVTGTSRIGAIAGLAARLPLLAACTGAGVLALIGFPPFSLFASELGIIRAGFSVSGGGGLAWVTAAVLLLILILIIAAALLTHASRMLLGPGLSSPDGTGFPAPEGTPPVPAARRPDASGLVPAVVALTACAVLGLYAGPLAGLLQSAARTLPGTP